MIFTIISQKIKKCKKCSSQFPTAQPKWRLSTVFFIPAAKQQIHTLKKQEPANVWYLCSLENDWNHTSVVRTLRRSVAALVVAGLTRREQRMFFFHLHCDCIRKINVSTLFPAYVSLLCGCRCAPQTWIYYKCYLLSQRRVNRLAWTPVVIITTTDVMAFSCMGQRGPRCLPSQLEPTTAGQTISLQDNHVMKRRPGNYTKLAQTT